MKKLIAVIPFLLLITACSDSAGPDISKHDKLFEHYASITEFSTKASVTAQYSDRASTFEFDFTSVEGTSELTLTAPSEIEGISVKLDGNGAVVRYEGVSVAAGALGDTGANPAEMLPKMLYLWQNGIPFETGSEKIGDVNCLSAAWNDGGLVWRTWFAEDDYRPVAAEIISGGQRTLFCLFS